MVLTRGGHDIIECFFSGGTDSAIACYIARARAREWGVPFRLIHIDTGVGTRTTEDYVQRYARWLNADLLIVASPYSYEDLAVAKGYPLLRKNRWCYEYLKLAPIGMLAMAELMEGLRKPLWVLGIRRGESLFRVANYDREWYTYTNELRRCHPNALRRFTRCYWCPVISWGPLEKSIALAKLKSMGMPENPIWREVGISGECLCMAGATPHTLDKLIKFLEQHEPETLEKLLRIDDLVQKKLGRSYPAPLVRLRKTLREYVEERSRL